LSQPAQASFDTLCQIFLPRSPGSGGSRAFGFLVQLDAMDHAGHEGLLVRLAAIVAKLAGRAGVSAMPLPTLLLLPRQSFFISTIDLRCQL
jgi:hypothetical protein